jgi:deoxyhypusine synthase
MKFKKVKQVTTNKDMKVNELIKELSESNVMGGGKLANAVDILEIMIKDKDCKVFFGVAGAMVPGGMRNVLLDFIENKWIDVFVTTGAMLTHDMVEALGFHHYQGSHRVDDAKLNKEGYDRMYDSFMPNNVYKDLENFFTKHFDELAKTETIIEFLSKLGSLLPEDSLLGACYKNKIPIFCPAIADSGIGLMIWGNLAKGKKVNVKAFDDLKDMLKIAWDVKKAGVFYVGGGVPKNYIQQAMQFAPKAAEYGVQLTMDRPELGGSSGAEMAEGISWGKMNEKAKKVDLICDATIALPVISAALKSRL